MFKSNKNLILLKIVFISVLLFIKLKYQENSSIKFIDDYDLVIPTSYEDCKVFLKHVKYYKRFINYSNIILIGPSKLNDINFNDTSILFIDEDKLLPASKINEFLWKMRSIKTKRYGWYEQQFLKMAYSKICLKEYYLIWDTDTIPIKSINFFENNHPFFDMKTEHHNAYFNTINILIPGLNYTNRSYISEHMIIKTNLMTNLIHKIESNDKIPGNFFWEKILMAIDIKDIHHSGFSEFETYGSYVDNKYPDEYNHRNWYSLRHAQIYFDNCDNLSEEDLNWLSQYYNALSFEKWKKFNKNNLKFVKLKIVHNYKPNIFFNDYNYFFKIYQ